jgi:hypothetical protein
MVNLFQKGGRKSLFINFKEGSMRVITKSIGVVLVVMSLSFLLAMPNHVFASPLFSLETFDDWDTALNDGRISPVLDPYPAADEHYGTEGIDYIFVPPDPLYIMEEIPEVSDAGLVMAWGDPAPANPDLPQLSAWEYVYDEDPNLVGKMLHLTVMAPLGIWSVSLTLNDAAGGWISWDWNVNTPGNPLGPGPINPGLPYSITIDPTVLGPQAGSTSFALAPGIGFNPAIVISIQADELAVGPAGWTQFPPVPVTGGLQPWNYWSSLSVTGCQSDAECDNGQFCDGSETCDPVNDCQAGTPPSVDDGVGCTDDSCDEVNDVIVNAPNDANCDNGQFCDGSETCDPVNDCQAGTDPCPGQTCDESQDICTPPSETNCFDGIDNDGDGQTDCTDTDCDGFTDGACSTGNVCTTGTITCQGGVEVCVAVNVPAGTACDDGLFCNERETCDANGVCQGGTPVDCSDGVNCTVDSCNEDTDSCDNEPDNGLCDDGQFCNGWETCDPVNDCQVGIDPCLVGEICDEGVDICVASCDFDPRTQGYWNRQCLGVPASEGGLDPGRKGRGPKEITEPGFVEELMPCADLRLEDLGFFGEMTCEGIDADPPSDPCERAKRQLTALILNVCSDRLTETCELDLSNVSCSAISVGGLIEEVSQLIQSDECGKAADCAALVNEGEGLVYDENND